jgi:hypothetical protein
MGKRGRKMYLKQKNEEIQFDYLKDKIINKIEKDDDEIRFYLSDCIVALFHEQNYYENVHVDKIDGCLDDLLEHPVLLAEEVCKEWTFYRLATIKGYVTITFRSDSNDYYSVSVTCEKREVEK